MTTMKKNGRNLNGLYSSHNFSLEVIDSNMKQLIHFWMVFMHKVMENDWHFQLFTVYLLYHYIIDSFHVNSCKIVATIFIQ